MIRRQLPVLLVVAFIATVGFAQKPGTHDRTIEVAGKERQYLVHVPRGLSKQKKTPLVLMLHGRSGNRNLAASRYYGWKPMADRHKFVVAFPQALGSPTSWDPSWGSPRPTPDARFLAALIESLVKEYRLDASRVFMTGHSSGGIMSFSFAGTHSEVVAAIAPVAGSIGVDRGRRPYTVPSPKVPVPVISFHGMKDRVVAYDKGRGGPSAYNLVSAPKSIAHFAKAAGYDGEPKRETINKGNVHVDSWSGGKSGARVVLYSIENGGHEWPTGRKNGVRATNLAWEFFARHGRKSEPSKPQRARNRAP